ncbi:MAG TPA: hypothetical protein VFT22_00850 [Kofleriaceae bacterium]|nr:hypothetical protein [Kofleriaceae bacterium]
MLDVAHLEPSIGDHLELGAGRYLVQLGDHLEPGFHRRVSCSGARRSRSELAPATSPRSSGRMRPSAPAPARPSPMRLKS